MQSGQQISLENNEDHQLILACQQYIYHSTWTWMGYFGGIHTACLAAGDSPSCLPTSVKEQWNNIRDYLNDYIEGHKVNPFAMLVKLRNIGKDASKNVNSSRRHPMTSGYYLKFNESYVLDDWNVLKEEFAKSKNVFRKK